tara:strand:+ start:1335 stop:1706 length:372 start_codon:yes stop_codon:yes gene_type:complete
MKKIILIFFSFIFSISVVFSMFEFHSVEAAEVKNDKLIERITKDYTNKFCNSMAFGLSKESSMNFSSKENSLIFKKKKGFESINKEFLAHRIAISVIDSCGYLIDLNGEEGINQFEKDYLSLI